MPCVTVVTARYGASVFGPKPLSGCSEAELWRRVGAAKAPASPAEDHLAVVGSGATFRVRIQKRRRGEEVTSCRFVPQYYPAARVHLEWYPAGAEDADEGHSSLYLYAQAGARLRYQLWLRAPGVPEQSCFVDHAFSHELGWGKTNFGPCLPEAVQHAEVGVTFFASPAEELVAEGSKAVWRVKDPARWGERLEPGEFLPMFVLTPS